MSYDDPRQPVLQFVLFEEEDRRKTNMVALYDLAPRFVFDIRTDVIDPSGGKKVIERIFAFGGKQYKITLKPTRMKGKDGVETDKYLGEREQIVEEVIRKMAASRNRLSLNEGKVRFPFTLHEVRHELRRVKHTYDLDEIKEAITILNEVPIRIESIENKRSPLLAASAFPAMAMRSRDDHETETFVEFNPLVAEAIRTLTYRQVSYELLMEIRDPISRWLYKRLHMEIAHHGTPVHVLTASEIQRDSGMSVWKTSRNALRRVRKAMEVLQKHGVLETIETEDVMQGLKKEDLVFTVQASESFMEEVKGSDLMLQDSRERFQSLGGVYEGEKFSKTNAQEAFNIRKSKKTLIQGR